MVEPEGFQLDQGQFFAGVCLHESDVIVESLFDSEQLWYIARINCTSLLFKFCMTL